MRTDVKLSTKFLTTQNAHQVGLLLTLSGEAPPTRAPINVALVLDRSGSMAGEPLDAARDAAKRFAGFLGAQDRLSVVIFDHDVATIFGPAPAGDPAALEAIARVRAGGSTNLSGGWLEGMNHVRAALGDGVNRVVLLTDGHANAGIVDVGQLAGLTQGAAAARVSTTCIGFGAGFNEDLLQAMARGGGGNYWYVESADRMGAMFDEEIDGLVSLAAQNVKVEVTLTHPRAQGISFLQAYPVTATPDNRWRITLGDCYATSPLMLGMIVHLDDVASLGPVEVAQVKVEADVVLAGGIEHRVTTMPVTANLDGQDHPEPTVEKTFLRFEAAKAREDAVRRADEGDFDGAASTLRAVCQSLLPYAAMDEAVQEELEDLRAESARLAEGSYDALDRKYHMARSSSAREMKELYRRKLSRRRPPEPQA